MKTKIIIVVLAILGMSCNSKKDESETTGKEVSEKIVTLTDSQLKNAGIVSEPMQKRTISATINVNGVIDVPPQNLVSVSMPLGGYLKNTKLLPGMYVKKNEVIAVMEDQQYIQLQQEYLTAQSKLFFAEKEYERQRDLNRDKASSDKVFQMADAEYKNLRITVNALAEKLKLIHINPKSLSEKTISKSVNIYSPINGFVSKVNVNIGKYVNASDILFELINPDDIHLNLKVFEKDINGLYIGQKLVAYSNSQPDKKYNCEIILISKDISSIEHSAEVHCHFQQYDKTLLPGMYMNAVIELKREAVLTLPEKAIVTFEGKEYVFVQLDNHKFEMIAVKVGNSENSFTEILNSEVLNTKNIAVKGAYTLLMQLKNKSEE
ncbi:efflux RND transporter periplasmic adaptor subunit [Flavobacterium sp. 102]|uniref:efflux RND transporter periplasmic adaptor subunit n=1 Tax=Flavobacterium sp. 102 TaxID=2135623 RepID=UPI000EB4E5EC|nr:efflux RND transporter periplasmic adaptor subunit [Flavobacterium sp. 102]RKS02181.1 cobalt-zinc-cadmium efflux system membrane fusion protein [Flavobacterium sp. 102]